MASVFQSRINKGNIWGLREAVAVAQLMCGRAPPTGNASGGGRTPAEQVHDREITARAIQDMNQPAGDMPCQPQHSPDHRENNRKRQEHAFHLP